VDFVFSWPVRIFVILLVLFSLFVDGAGYIYRFVHHIPLNAPLPHSEHPNFGGWQIYLHKGLDLEGGTRLLLKLEDFPKGSNPCQVQASSILVLERRVNALGVNEPQIQGVGCNEISVELAGVNAATAQAVLGKTARLEFYTWVPDPKAPAGYDGDPQAGYRPKPTGLTGAMLVKATPVLNPTTNTWEVELQFNSQGAALFDKLTRQAVQQVGQENHIAAFLDLTKKDLENWDKPGVAAKLTNPVSGKMLSDPAVQQEIPNGNAVITGNFTATTAAELADELNAGALPATIKVISSQQVGATLGQQAVNASFLAGLLGLAIVVIFMIAYYRLPGLIASIALMCYGAIVLALFKIIPVTLTLAGMAGFVLSIGMAVDANVLIFERFKEEMRAGRTIGAAVEAGVRRAWPAIRDSNFSTIITTIILLFFGNGDVKGFAVTLLIGVCVSMLSAIVITHNLLYVVMKLVPIKNYRLFGVPQMIRRPEATA